MGKKVSQTSNVDKIISKIFWHYVKITKLVYRIPVSSRFGETFFYYQEIAYVQNHFRTEKYRPFYYLFHIKRILYLLKESILVILQIFNLFHQPLKKIVERSVFLCAEMALDISD